LKTNKVPEMAKSDSGSEKGIITALLDNDAIVEFSLQDSCESCGARMICVPDNTGKRRLRAANPQNARIGDEVSLTEKSNFLLLVSFLQYGLPLILFFLVILALYLAKVSLGPVPKELIWFLGGLAGLLVGALISRHFVERLAAKGGSFFEISEILG
jgi:positive regulator of sigma E activity